MKKLVLLLFVFTLNELHANIPIISITKADGGKRGYKYVTASMGTNVAGTEGWIVNCTDPGISSCAPPMGGAIPEGITQEEFNRAVELISYAEDMWDQGITHGTYITTVLSPTGQNSDILVSWSVNDRIINISVEKVTG